MHKWWPAQLACMAAAQPGDLAGLRDRTLLLLAAAGLGSAALIGLDAERICFTANAVELPVSQPAGPTATSGTRSWCREARPWPPARCRCCGTGCATRTRGSGRSFGKSTAGARSSIAGLAPMRSAGSWRGAGFAAAARRRHDARGRRQASEAADAPLVSRRPYRCGIGIFMKSGLATTPGHPDS